MSETTGKDVQVIEVNGIKLEVDMRYALRIDTFKVGDATVLKEDKIMNDWYDINWDDLTAEAQARFRNIYKNSGVDLEKYYQDTINPFAVHTIPEDLK